MIEIDEVALLRMVKLGFSTSTIADLYECHISTVTNRLKKMGIAPMDGRRNFIEEVFFALSEEEKKWLINELEYFDDIKDLIANMFKAAYERNNSKQ